MPQPEGPKPPERRDDAYLWDMLEAAREVTAFVAGKRWHDYEQSLLLRRAVERSIEIIGEASRRVSREFRDAHPEIPWPKIVGQRHRLAHEYGEIVNLTIWRVATIHVPALIPQLESLVPPPPPDPLPEPR